MIEVRKTKEFQDWLTNLRDQRAIARITIRIARVEAGLMGDVKYFDGIGELRCRLWAGVSHVLRKTRPNYHHLALWWRQAQPEARY